jgi:hypothetical protein
MTGGMLQGPVAIQTVQSFHILRSTLVAASLYDLRKRALARRNSGNAAARMKTRANVTLCCLGTNTYINASGGCFDFEQAKGQHAPPLKKLVCLSLCKTSLQLFTVVICL